MIGSNRLPRWLLALAFALLVVVVLGPLGMIVWNLQRQRALQDTLEEQDRDLIIYSEDHPLREWLPDSLGDRLPATDLELEFDGEKDLQLYRRYGQQLNDVRALRFYECALTETDWRAILCHRHLEELTLFYTPVTDAQFSQLQGQTNLRDLHIVNVPISDASLTTLASLALLEQLGLYRTQVTLDAIEAFAAAHPQMAVGWSREFTPEEQAICDELKTLGLPIEPISHAPYIARVFRWELGLPKDTLLKPRMIELLQALNGSVETLHIQGSLRPAALELLDELPTITSVQIQEIQSLSEFEQLATRTHVQTITMKSYAPDMPSDDRQAIYEKWRHKTGHFPRWPPFFMEDLK